jgi:hypothetical protein
VVADEAGASKEHSRTNSRKCPGLPLDVRLVTVEVGAARPVDNPPTAPRESRSAPCPHGCLRRRPRQRKHNVVGIQAGSRPHAMPRPSSARPDIERSPVLDGLAIRPSVVSGRRAVFPVDSVPAAAQGPRQGPGAWAAAPEPPGGPARLAEPAAGR